MRSSGSDDEAAMRQRGSSGVHACACACMRGVCHVPGGVEEVAPSSFYNNNIFNKQKQHISWWHPASKNILRLEAGYPALRCHILNNQQVTRTQHTRDKNKDDTGNSNTPKHSHTHKTHSRNDERQRLSSCCQSRCRRPRDHRRWFDARRAAEGGDVVGLTVRSMVTVATPRPPRQPAIRPTQAHLLTLSLLPTRGTGHPL